MVKIRLKRMGTTKRPSYRLVVADSRSPRDGRFIESLGWYDPLPAERKVEINGERVKHWLQMGARPSESARDLLVAQGLMPKGSRPLRPAVAPKAAPEPEAKAEAPSAPAPAAHQAPAAEAEAAATAAEAETSAAEAETTATEETAAPAAEGE